MGAFVESCKKKKKKGLQLEAGIPDQFPRPLLAGKGQGERMARPPAQASVRLDGLAVCVGPANLDLIQAITPKDPVSYLQHRLRAN